MNLVWLRNDLRLDDNPALFAACQRGSKVQVVFFACDQQWKQHNEAAVKISFWQQAVNDLQSKLSQRGIPLFIIQCQTYQNIPLHLLKHCQQHRVTDVHFNREYALHEISRDDAVKRELQNSNIGCHSYQSDLIASASLLNKQGLPYRVFTPWYRAWIKQLTEADLTPFNVPDRVDKAIIDSPNPVEIIKNAQFREDLFPASEVEAHKRLHQFIQLRLPNYQEQRDIPSVNATSTLSPYLSSGLISLRRCLHEIRQHAQLDGADWRIDPWVRQLGWREFYRYLMLNFPRLSMNRAFIRKTESITWERNEENNRAWKLGLTGYPIIDAGMRQMARTGWMHNRLRMLCASFYSKLMLSDWHLGEAFFMQSLIDGDFASNNGGWQWCASTGCDASPWFRIFNPHKQSQKFDANGDFIRKMVPELANLDKREIHAPPLQACEKYNYPQPIIDYTASRQRALQRFKDTLG